MNEAATRAEHLDPALAAAGWGVVEGSRILREYKITLGRIEGRGRHGTPEVADYMPPMKQVGATFKKAPRAEAPAAQQGELPIG